MTREDSPRQELGSFLRDRRSAAIRSEYDLPTVGRGRTTGLRREEIAFLSGVSVTWYTWLEQGRDINPSRQVIDAIAVQLRLTEAEHDYVLGLAGFAPSSRPALAEPEPVPPHVQHLLDALDPAPTFALTSHWDIAGWNSAYETLFPGVTSVESAERNLLQLIFTDPEVRMMLPEWDVTSRRFLAEYRADAGGRIASPAHVRLIQHLRATSAEFSRAWEERSVERFASRRRTFEHPTMGRLEVEQVNLLPQDAPDLRVITYLPLLGELSAEAHTIIR